ncbi:hypothetical protein, partial [Mesorhizobium sp.]|uniref:hypothetical protein n=1 Tax=Mesorhizobium sp. TaxID=1871066 RepID=UPI001AC00FC7
MSGVSHWLKKGTSLRCMLIPVRLAQPARHHATRSGIRQAGSTRILAGMCAARGKELPWQHFPPGFRQRSAAAMLPPSTVVTSAVVRSASA